MFHQFLANVKIALKDIFAYRFDVLIWNILTPIQLAIYYFLWKAIYSNTGTAIIRGYTFNELIVYFILTSIAAMFIWTDVDQQMSEYVRQGTLINKLARPITVFKSMVYRNIGQLLFILVAQAIPLVAIGAVFFNLSLTSWSNLILTLISISLAAFLSLIFVFLVGLSSFWVTRYHGIRQIKNGLTWFLGGSVIPLAFFPQFWQKVFDFMPFKYMINAPVQIYLGKADAIFTIGLQIIWIVVLFLLIKIAWPKALARFSAVGG